MELTKLENLLDSPEQPRTKRGLPSSNDPDMSVFVDRNTVSRTPKLPAKPNETLIESIDFPATEGPRQTKDSLFPAESDEEVDNAMESEPTFILGGSRLIICEFKSFENVVIASANKLFLQKNEVIALITYNIENIWA